MLNGLKNFAINRVLRHVADNAKLNVTTNILAVVITAALAIDANWVLLISYLSAPTPEGLHELIRVSSSVIAAVLLYLVGKFPGLKGWLPVAQDVLAEAGKELEVKPNAKLR